MNNSSKHFPNPLSTNIIHTKKRNSSSNFEEFNLNKELLHSENINNNLIDNHSTSFNNANGYLQQN